MCKNQDWHITHQSYLPQRSWKTVAYLYPWFT